MIILKFIGFLSIFEVKKGMMVFMQRSHYNFELKKLNFTGVKKQYGTTNCSVETHLIVLSCRDAIPCV